MPIKVAFKTSIGRAAALLRHSSNHPPIMTFLILSFQISIAPVSMTPMAIKLRSKVFFSQYSQAYHKVRVGVPMFFHAKMLDATLPYKAV
jgi:hypothetical protein